MPAELGAARDREGGLGRRSPMRERSARYCGSASGTSVLRPSLPPSRYSETRIVASGAGLGLGGRPPRAPPRVERPASAVAPPTGPRRARAGCGGSCPPSPLERGRRPSRASAGIGTTSAARPSEGAPGGAPVARSPGGAGLIVVLSRPGRRGRPAAGAAARAGARGSSARPPSLGAPLHRRDGVAGCSALRRARRRRAGGRWPRTRWRWPWRASASAEIEPSSIVLREHAGRGVEAGPDRARRQPRRAALPAAHVRRVERHLAHLVEPLAPELSSSTRRPVRRSIPAA